MDEKRLYFIGILTPPTLREKVYSIKEEFAGRFQSRHALKVPSHITLQEPFSLRPSDETKIKDALVEFFEKFDPIQMTCKGFGAFAKRSKPVIYIHVLENPWLSKLRNELQLFLRKHSFVGEQIATIQPSDHSTVFLPHISVANRDLSKVNFRLAWPEFSKRSFDHEFLAENAHLLRHNGKIWEAVAEFALIRHPLIQSQ